MTIKITNGEVEIKEFMTHKERKEINEVLLKGASITEGGQPRVDLSAMDRVKDATLLKMITKITIGGKEMPITVDTLDGLDTKDFSNIFNAVDELTKEIVEKKTE